MELIVLNGVLKNVLSDSKSHQQLVMPGLFGSICQTDITPNGSDMSQRDRAGRCAGGSEMELLPLCQKGGGGKEGKMSHSKSKSHHDDKPPLECISSALENNQRCSESVYTEQQSFRQQTIKQYIQNKDSRKRSQIKKPKNRNEF